MYSVAHGIRTSNRSAKVILSAVVVFAGIARAHFSVAAEPQTFDSAGVKIRYFVQGTGEPVVLVHGLYSSAKLNWDLPGVTAMLAKDFQVVSLDLRGHGESDKPNGEDKYGVEMAEDVVRLMDHLKIDRAHLVGYSMGGMIVGKLLAKHPDRALSANLGGMGWLREGSGLQKFWEVIPSREGGRTPTGLMSGMAKLAITEDELRSIKVPVEVLVGDHDPVRRLYVTPLESVRNDWPVIEIRDAGHITCLIRPQYKEELQKWLEKQRKAK